MMDRQWRECKRSRCGWLRKILARPSQRSSVAIRTKKTRRLGTRQPKWRCKDVGRKIQRSWRSRCDGFQRRRWLGAGEEAVVASCAKAPATASQNFNPPTFTPPAFWRSQKKYRFQVFIRKIEPFSQFGIGVCAGRRPCCGSRRWKWRFVSRMLFG